MKKSGLNSIKALALLTQIGIGMFVPIFVMLIIGVKLDEYFSTSPIQLIIFLILGIVIAFRNLFKLFKKITKDIENE